MKAPKYPWTLMMKIYRDVLPEVNKQLKEWTAVADQIPDPELRKQALDSIRTKTFHCEGGSIYSILAGKENKTAIQFIVAYQTISDYLDNLCDRSTSLDPEDFRTLHKSMLDALTPDADTCNYYCKREEQNDGGYLVKLVEACQDALKNVSDLQAIRPHLIELCEYYCDLQVHKHVLKEERVPRLKEWFETHEQKLPKMSWNEFSASAGSTLGIFCLVSYSLYNNGMTTEEAKKIKEGYFPYVQGLHILLDYFVDQEEDRQEGDLNFCFYYRDEEELANRVGHFMKEADRSVKRLPDSQFHRLINKGLIGIYLADRKVMQQKDVRSLARKIIRFGGRASFFFYFNGWFYRRLHRASQ
ncbi:tetraprenyl-beta-curcumene synthase family protein [Pseudalkalibacillus caeni]|uniref:Tetraprenyl-beta-curcumene synthase family protein n=1 Tax=Exobacillus caeni TaxID=2574798 RepID=A0A5R9FEM7_9BACL|nr:tetraprenyl-beta-curcumene synthase family protein [Pseudalkalibacillus caeni]TLS39034.1 tetraprenyl-beta-curcumene synthase family protein [Pseudalkalibacillus caeni]